MIQKVTRRLKDLLQKSSLVYPDTANRDSLLHLQVLPLVVVLLLLSWQVVHLLLVLLLRYPLHLVVVQPLQRHYPLAVRLQVQPAVLVPAVPAVPVPAAVDLAVLQVLQVPLDRLDLVVHLDPQDLADHQVVEDTTAADTRNTKVLSYRNSKERRVRCAC